MGPAVGKKVTSVFAAHQCTPETKMREKLQWAVISPLKCSAMLNVRPPALIDYVAFYQTVPVPHRYPEEGTL